VRGPPHQVKKTELFMTCLLGPQSHTHKHTEHNQDKRTGERSLRQRFPTPLHREHLERVMLQSYSLQIILADGEGGGARTAGCISLHMPGMCLYILRGVGGGGKT
jgi:hypothetical protein